MSSAYAPTWQPLPSGADPGHDKARRDPYLEPSWNHAAKLRISPSAAPSADPLGRHQGFFSGFLSMYRRGDFGQVARALRVLEALRGFKQGRWVSEVAAEVSASERTVRRDIIELQDAGF